MQTKEQREKIKDKTGDQKTQHRWTIYDISLRNAIQVTNKEDRENLGFQMWLIQIIKRMYSSTISSVSGIPKGVLHFCIANIDSFSCSEVVSQPTAMATCLDLSATFMDFS